ncbi:MAG: hypothetical protein ACOC1F_09510 [Myxococcota bacterium]
MLPPFIIEQIRRREEPQQEHRPQPQLDLPVDERPSRESSPPEEPGVVIIPLWD